MSLRCTSFFAQDKPRTNPHSASAQHERRSQRLSVEQATRSHNLHLVTRHRTLLSPHHLSDRGDEDRGGDIPRVSSTFTALCADHVDADF